MSQKLFNTASGFPRTAYGIQVSFMRPYLHQYDYQYQRGYAFHVQRTKSQFLPVKVWDCSQCRRPVFYRRLAWDGRRTHNAGLFICDRCWA